MYFQDYKCFKIGTIKLMIIILITQANSINNNSFKSNLYFHDINSLFKNIHMLKEKLYQS